MIVTPAKPKTIAPPFWKSEGLSRNFHYAERVGNFLETAEQRIDDTGFTRQLINDYFLEQRLADELISLLQRQRAHCQSKLPHRHHLLIEKTQTSPGGSSGHQVILHTGWGAKVNRPLAMAMEAAWQQRWGEQPEVWVSNESLVVQLSHDTDATELLSLVAAHNIEDLLRKRLEGSGFFGARFRENAGRALLLSKGKFNERKPLWMSRLQSQKLMDSVMKFEDFPILLETWRTCLQDEFDLDNLKMVLAEIESGEIEVTEVTTANPSPFAQTVAWGQINSYMYKDDQPKASKTSKLSRSLLQEIVFQAEIRPAIPLEIIESFVLKRQRTFNGYAPDNPIDLIEWVKERTAVPVSEWEDLLSQSACSWQEVEDKLSILNLSGSRLIVPAGDKETLSRSLLDPDLPHLANWLQYYGPISTSLISEKVGAGLSEIEALLSQLAHEKVLIHGQLIVDDTRTYWCDSDNYEILLRLVRQAARVTFESLPVTRLTPFLHSWQTRNRFESSNDRLFELFEILRSYPASAALWEAEILPARIPGYQTQQLDLFFQEGYLYWLGDEKKRINFTFREDLDLIANEPATSSKHLPVVFQDVDSRYDFGTLVDKSGLSASDMAEQLWQAVWQGLISNDSISALRKGIESQFKVEDITRRHQTRNQRRLRRSGFSSWRSSMPFAGNWFKLDHPGRHKDLIEREEINKDRVRVLLDRYGIVFRELLSHETTNLQWPNVFRSLRLMELSGEVYSGYFFQNIPGPQFISPGALRFLVGTRRDKIFWINATDPISNCGMPIDELRDTLPRRVVSNHLTYHGNDLVMVSERNGKALTIHVPPDHPGLDRYFIGLKHLIYRSFQPLKKITIESINNQPARKSPYFPSLENSFEVVSDYKAIYLQRSMQGAPKRDGTHD